MDLSLAPNVSADGKDFFQSDHSLLEEARRETKRAEMKDAGDPIPLPSKVLCMLLPEVHVPADDTETTAPGIYVGESGHVARKISLENGKTLCLYRGHSGPVTCLALSYDLTGKETALFTGSWDKTIRKFDVKTSATLLVMKGHADFVKCLKLHGTTVLSGSSDATIKTWNAATGDCITTWKGHTRAVESLAVDADAQKVYSASSDTTIRVWDLESGTERGTLKGHLTSVYGLALGDGELWSASADKTAKRWNLETMACDTTLEHPDFVKTVAVVGPYVVTGGRDENLRFWDAANGVCVRLLQGHFGEVSSLVMNGNKIFSGSLDCTVRSWDIVDIFRARDQPADAVAAALAAESVDAEPPAQSLTEEEELELMELMQDG